LLEIYALVIIAATSCILVYVAIADLQNYTIKNELVLLLAALYFIYVFATDRWDEVLSHIGIALLAFLGLLASYSYRLLGGGDVKLLTVAFLWVGVECAFLFAVAMLVMSGVHVGLVYIGALGAQTTNGRKRIPYAPAIAGGLVVVFSSGCVPHAQLM
jgi:prepilin peptidase CpaA